MGARLPGNRLGRPPPRLRQLEINRVRQRLAVQIWRDYQEHITARIRYADPDADARTRLEEEMEQEEEEAEQALVRLYNEAYLQRTGRPQEFGV